MLVNFEASVIFELKIGRVLEVVGLRTNAYAQDYHISRESLAILEFDAADNRAIVIYNQNLISGYLAVN